MFANANSHMVSAYMRFVLLYRYVSLFGNRWLRLRGLGFIQVFSYELREYLLGRPYGVTGGLIKCSWCFFLFFQRQISELPQPIAVKLCHVIGTCVSFIMQVQKFGGLSPQKIWGQKHAKFRSILYTLALWSRISQERLKISKIGKLIDRE